MLSFYAFMTVYLNIFLWVNYMDKNENSYLELIDEQIEWHDKRAIKEKTRHTRLRMTATILTALIPVFSLIGAYCNTIGAVCSIVSAVLAAAITSVEAYHQIKQPDNLFTIYRMTWGDLKQEKYNYLNSIDEYVGKSTDEKYQIFAERCGRILKKTNELTMSTQKHKP